MTDYRVEPLTAERWPDLVALFGPSGAHFQCWCMDWRLPRAHFEDAGLRRGNRDRLRRRVRAGPPPGLLAYDGDDAVGWIQVGPRSDVTNWNGARRLSAPLPDTDPADPGAWAISCFVVARRQRVRWLEACPVEVTCEKRSISLYHGVA